MNDTDQTTYIPLKDRKRHPKLWFDDGNIIIATNLSVFRVHRGMLSMNSEVFADMLSIPQPKIEENPFGGLPIVEMTDNDEDFTHLLHYFYDHRYYYDNKPTTFSIMSGLLRMSTKYQLDALRDEIISHFAKVYQPTFHGTPIYLPFDPISLQFSLFPEFKGQHFAVVALARETNASILLPSALWRSSCEHANSITNGIIGDSGILYQLPPTDLKHCLKGKYMIFAAIIRFAFALPGYLTSEKCKRDGVGECRRLAITETANYFSRNMVNLNIFYQLGPFKTWNELVCEGCKEVAELRTTAYLNTLWKKLPSVFGLPNWEED